MTERKPTFSVIVPVYGVEAYIARCAESLFRQTYPGAQFIFVNDGTKDASMDVLAELIDNHYPSMRDRTVIINKENAGLPAARKSGLASATGDFIVHVDSDDWVEEDLLEQLAAKIMETGCDFVYYDIWKEYGNRRKKKVEHEYDASTRNLYIQDIGRYRAKGFLWNKCVRRSIYEDNNVLFAPCSMHEDIYLSCQLICYATHIEHLHSCLYHYRRNNSVSISRSKKEGRRFQEVTNMMDLYNYFKDHLEGSPIEPMLGDVFYAAGWNTLLFHFDFFERYPFIVDRIRELPVSTAFRLPVLVQLYVKMKLPKKK